MPFHSLGAWGLVLGAVGVLTLVGVVISGLAAPNPFFPSSLWLDCCSAASESC